MHNETRGKNEGITQIGKCVWEKFSSQCCTFFHYHFIFHRIFFICFVRWLWVIVCNRKKNFHRKNPHFLLYVWVSGVCAMITRKKRFFFILSFGLFFISTAEKTELKMENVFLAILHCVEGFGIYFMYIFHGGFLHFIVKLSHWLPTCNTQQQQQQNPSELVISIHNCIVEGKKKEKLYTEQEKFMKMFFIPQEKSI